MIHSRAARAGAAVLTATALTGAAVGAAAPASAAGPRWSSSIGSHTKTKCYAPLYVSCTMYVDYINFSAKSRTSTGGIYDVDLIRQRGRVWSWGYGTLRYDSTYSGYNASDAYRKYTGTVGVSTSEARGDAAFQERGFVSWYPVTQKTVWTYALVEGEKPPVDAPEEFSEVSQTPVPE